MMGLLSRGIGKLPVFIEITGEFNWISNID
jgi:hypothetical protein